MNFQFRVFYCKFFCFFDKVFFSFIFFSFFPKQIYTKVQSTTVTQITQFNNHVLCIIIQKQWLPLAENPFIWFCSIWRECSKISNRNKTIQKWKLNKYIKTNIETNKQTKNILSTHPVCFLEITVKLLVKFYL